MKKFTQDYQKNTELFDGIFHVEENFDIIKKTLKIGADELTLYYIDGFVKDAIMQKLMTHFVSLGELNSHCEQGESAAKDFMERNVTYVESDLTEDVDSAVQMVMSGAVLIVGSVFGEYGIIVDARTYPARNTGEPEGDKVMRGARDGFVETLIFNTALIRRRIRNPSLTMSYLTVGKDSRTDIVVCYMSDRADMQYVDELKKKLNNIKTDSLALGHESLAECLIKKRWYNPFPKIRYTERPDSASAQLLEGSVLILIDNSPEVMVLPTSIFDFMQETNDFYFPPLTGSYIRIVRHIVFWLALFMIPLWYYAATHENMVPGWLSFVIPRELGRLPLLAQILLAEFIIDGLRMASLNTPNMLSNSLSVVGGLILGDFAVDIGWLIPEVILYMAFVAIANFTQRSYELGYAFKFMRIILLILTAIFGGWGLVGGSVLILILIATNKTVNGKRSYLYPLIPFNWRALKSLFIRVRKSDLTE
ncbi:MAG: spore germination protein [Ruminococcaceae bacterium]|nr:spore germination protein [Oscillospiraceae bacterium]